MRIPRAIAIGLASTTLLAASVMFSTAPAVGFIGHPLIGQITEANGDQFGQPWGLASDTSGNLFVADATGKAIDVFNSANAFTTQLGAGAFPAPYTRSVSVNDATGVVYVAESGPETVDVLKPEGAGKYALLQERKFSNYVYVAVNNSSGPHAGDVYVISGSGSIHVIKPNSNGELVEAGEELSPPEEGFSLLGPNSNGGLAFDTTTGTLYVANPGKGVVDEYNANNEPLTQRLQSSAGSFAPVAVAVEEFTHNVYVVDGANDVVDEFDGAGKQIEAIVSSLVSPLGVAVSSSGQIYVSDAGSTQPTVDVFGPAVLLPDLTTGAGEIGRVSARLEGVVNPDGAMVTSCQFEYGTSAAYGHTVPCVPAPGSGSSPVSIDADLMGLTQETTYHYRLVAGNSNGINPGVDKTFNTSSAVEGVLTGSASKTQGTSAVLGGSLEPNGFDASYWFEYGRDQSYGFTTPHQDAGEASEVKSASATVTGLEPNATYHFRLAAENGFGVTYGVDETFTTEAIAPEIGQQQPQPSGITRTAATVLEKLNPDGSPTTYRILYGETSKYGQHTAEFEAGNGFNEETVRAGLLDLAPGVTYHYAVIATNHAGTVTGPDQTFTTAAPSPPGVSTGGASNVTLTAATISGTIDPQGLETSYELELGTGTTYGTSIYGEAGASGESIELTVGLENLAPGAVYHYRFVAINSDGRTYGADQVFVTPAYSKPIVLPSALPLIQTPAIAFPTETSPTIVKKTVKKGKSKKTEKRKGGKGARKAKHKKKK